MNAREMFTNKFLFLNLSPGTREISKNIKTQCHHLIVGKAYRDSNDNKQAYLLQQLEAYQQIFGSYITSEFGMTSQNSSFLQHFSFTLR